MLIRIAARDKAGRPDLDMPCFSCLAVGQGNSWRGIDCQSLLGPGQIAGRDAWEMGICASGHGAPPENKADDSLTSPVLLPIHALPSGEL